MKKLLAILLFSVPLAAQTINPNQIRPSAITGDVLTTPVGGQPPIWHAPIAITATSPILVNGGAGPVSVGTANISCPDCGGTSNPIQMSIVPPVPGQFVILFPKTNVFNGGALSLDNSDWGCEIVGASGLITTGSCDRTLSGPWVDVNGKTLAQLGIPTGNVTNIYGFTISNFNPGYFSDGSGVSSIVGLSCTGLAPTALANNNLETAQVNALSGLVGSGINSATCDVHIQRNSSISTTSSNSNLNIYAIGLIVYYTGTPVPAPTALNIAYGLAYNPETNTLLTDPSYPVGQIGINVADLPSPTGVPPSEYIVKDALTPLDCTAGRGSFIHSCLNISGAWTTPLEFNGLLQSMAGICPAGTNGQFTNVSCNFGGALTDAPTEVKSGNLPNTSPCTATDTFTAGNALVVVLQNNTAPPTDASDTFNLVWNASISGTTTATYIATNIAGGSTTISATGLCRGTYTELTNVKVASPIDGTPVTHTQGTTPVAYTVGPLTTANPNDLIFTSELTCSGTPTIGLGFKQLGNGSIGPEGYVDSAIGSGIGEGVYQATWTSAPVCVGSGGSAYGIFAIKSAHSGGGGTGTPGGSNGNLQYNNAGAFGGDANTNDDGAGNLTAKSYATTGGSGQGGTVDMTEGTAASAAVGHDVLYADSTAHCIKQSLNNGSFACLGSSAGTVTSVSVTTANGVSGSVATATTTPAITLTLGAITPTSVVPSTPIAHANIASTAVTPGSYTNLNATIAADGSITAASNGSGAGLSGMTAGQVAIAATASTVTSSKVLAGSGAGITTGPTTSTNLDCAQFSGTTGQIADAGAPCGSGSSYPALTSVSVSAANVLDLSACFSSSYDTYSIYSDGPLILNSGSNNVTTAFRFKVGGSFDTATNYYYARSGSGGALSSDSKMIITGFTGDTVSTSGDSNFFQMTVSSVNGSGIKGGSWFWQGLVQGSRYSAANGYIYINTGVITGMEIYTTATFTGTVKCQPLPQ